MTDPTAVICYLCGLPIKDGSFSDDHAVPVALMARTQPKAKGFDYGGKLPTHAECNNRFGPETYVAKAIDLLEFLAGTEGHHDYQHRTHPHITIKALDSSKLPKFTRRDMAFFKFLDVRDKDDAEFSDPEFFVGKPKKNPTRDALYVAMSVLAKSAAALLIKRDLHAVPSAWRIYAVPYSGATDAISFDEPLGRTKSFDTGIHVWRKQLGDTEWFVAFRAKSILLYLVFVLADKDMGPMIRQIFNDPQVHEFTGSCLNALLTTGWRQL